MRVRACPLPCRRARAYPRLRQGQEGNTMGFDEYMFFDEALRDRFVDFAAGHGIASTVRKDEIAGFVVALPDGLADELQEAVDAEYESIMDEQMLRAESDEDLVSHHAAGLTVTLADGTTRAIRIPLRSRAACSSISRPMKSTRSPARSRKASRIRSTGRSAASRPNSAAGAATGKWGLAPSSSFIPRAACPPRPEWAAAAEAPGARLPRSSPSATRRARGGRAPAKPAA